MRVIAALALAAAVACSENEPGGAAPDAASGSGGTGGGGSAGTGANGGSSGGTDAGAGSGGSGGRGGSGAASDAGDAGFDGSLRLSETGLYADVASATLAPGVVEFRPAYELWSDGATKRRFLYLPPGAPIDTTDMDYWVYPEGTKVWKEFTRDGVRVETRLLHKRGPTAKDWLMVAYQWDDAQADALAVPGGVKNASGTPHDIPRTTDCAFCHEGLKDRLLGVTAIQLTHALGGLTIDTLIQEDRLTTPPAAPITLPGSDTDRAALGYLHANCGNCHNPTSLTGGVSVDLNLWLTTRALASVKGTVTYQSTVNVPTTTLAPATAPNRITPGSPETSSVFARMELRGTGIQMPPLASEAIHAEGVATLRAWIESL